MMYRTSYLFVISSLLFFSACEKDKMIILEEVIESPTSTVPAALIDHFANFEGEALARGFFINLKELGITAEFRDIDEGSVVGVCTTNGITLRNISIDLNFWNSASNALREMIVFHELGHCALGQDHREDSFNNGICKSIMRSGTGECVDYYKTETRKYYLDELFL